MPEDPGGRDQIGDRVLMLAPTARDGAMARSILADSGIASAVFESFEGLARALEEGAGAIILMEEFFVSADAPRLSELLARQPAWSNLPLVVLSAEKDRLSEARTAARSFSNVVLLEQAGPDRAAGQRHQGGAGRAAEAVRDPRQHRGDPPLGRGAGPALQGRRGGPGRGRGRQPHEGRVPRDPLARAADPAQCHRRLGQDPPLGQGRRAGHGGGPRGHRAELAGAGPAHRGPARHLADHLGQAEARRPAAQPGRGHRGRDRRRHARRGRPGHPHPQGRSTRWPARSWGMPRGSSRSSGTCSPTR